MITITNQILLTSLLTLDPKESNVVLDGGSIKIETINEYLQRVDLYNRYLGLDVIIQSPFGIYTIDSYMNLLQTKNITFSKYAFSEGVLDGDFSKVIGVGIVIIDDLLSNSTTNVLSANQGKILKELIDNKQNVGNYIEEGDSRLSNARPASDVSAWAKSPTEPTYTKESLGLANIDNTSDVNKPISNATQTALNLKANVSSLGTASTENVGVGANNVIQLDVNSKLPAVDGSQLTNLPIPDVSKSPNWFLI